jgi:hypothetical protein
VFEYLSLGVEIAGPAFVGEADINDDGLVDLFVSGFGGMGFSVPNGTLTVLYNTGDLQNWDVEVVIAESDGIPFPNGVTAEDLDGDGDLDLLVPSGFLVCEAIPIVGGPCGGIAWYENQQGAWEQHVIVENTQTLFYHHGELVDLDQDGIRDMVIVGEKRVTGLFGGAEDAAELQWLKGTTTGPLFESTPHTISLGGGSFPRLRDLDGDGDMDIASNEFFFEGGSFAWFEQVAAPTTENPAGEFVRHVIADDVGPSIMFQFADDLYGDGVSRAVGANHTNTQAGDSEESAIYVFEVPTDPFDTWTRQQVSTGIVSEPGSQFAPQAAPGIFGLGDVDDDGDTDIVVSGDGDPRIFWLEQQRPGVFETRVAGTGRGQAGGMIVGDYDQDGTHEWLVTSYENNTVEFFKWVASSP